MTLKTNYVYMKYNKTFVDIANKSSNGKLPGYFKVVLVQSEFNKLMYSYSSNIQIKRDGSPQQLSNITSKVIFSVQKKIQADGIYAIFETIDSHIEDTNLQGKKMGEIGKLFAIPIHRLVLKLDEKGEIKDVINKQEIIQKWEKLFAEITEGMDEKFKETVKKEGDADFYNPYKSIKGSFLHTVFFLPVFLREYTTGKKDCLSIEDKSKLLNNTPIMHYLDNKIDYVDENNLTCSYHADSTDKDDMLKKARKIYKELVPKESAFSQSLDIICHFSLTHNLPLHIETRCDERISNALQYIHVAEIKLLN
jgi:hypothetical protein